MADPDVEILRGLSGVRNTRLGGRPKGAQFRADLADAASAFLRAGIDGVEITQVGAGTPATSGEGQFTFTLAPYRKPSRSSTWRTSSKAAAIRPRGKRICPSPWMFENSSHPSSSSTIARVKPRRP